jgi:hypothetical protein
MIRFQCDHCGRRLRANDGTAGKQLRCPGCGAVITIPAAESGFKVMPPVPAPSPAATVPRTAPTMPKKKRRKAPARGSPGRGTWILIGARSLAAVLVITVLVIAFSSSGSSQPSATTTAPAGANKKESAAVAALQVTAPNTVAQIPVPKKEPAAVDPIAVKPPDAVAPAKGEPANKVEAPTPRPDSRETLLGSWKGKYANGTVELRFRDKSVTVTIRHSLGFALGTARYDIDAETSEIKFSPGTAAARQTKDGTLVLAGDFQIGNSTYSIPQTRLERGQPKTVAGAPVATAKGESPAPESIAGKERPEPFRYLPDETAVFATVNVRQLLDTALIARYLPKLRQEWAKQQALPGQLPGFDPLADVSRISVAGANLLGSEWFVLVQGRFELDKLRAWAKSNLREQRVPVGDGQEALLYEATSGQAPAWYVAVVGPTAVVASTNKSWIVAAFAEQAGKRQHAVQSHAMRALLDRFEPGASVWAAALGSTLPTPPELRVESLTGTVTVHEQVQAAVQVACADASSAAALSQMVDQALPAFKAEMLKAVAGPGQRAALVRSLDGLKRQTQDRMVKLHVTVGPAVLALLEENLPAETPAQKDRLYRFRPSDPLAFGRAHNISIREEAGGRFTIKGLGADSVVPATLDLGGGGAGKFILPGAPGSTRMRVLVNRSLGYTTLAGLRFQDNATVDVQKDGSVEVDRAGIRAVDAQGGRYVSEPYALSLVDNKLHMAMVRVGQQGPGKPFVTGAPDAGKVKAGPSAVRVRKVIRARKVHTGDGTVLIPNLANREVALVLKIENVPADVMKDGLGLFRDSYVMVGSEKRTFNTLTTVSGSGTIWAATLIPTSARTLTLHLSGLPAQTVNLPPSVVSEARIGG